MEISSLAQTTQTVETTKASSASQISSDFETFLLMLTTQLENQDPLNPVDSSDYATQLATFSGVEQQVKTNDLLEALGQKFGEMGLAQLSGWVGMEARVAAPAHFDGQPITLYPSMVPTADSAKLIVQNEVGQTVDEHQIELGDAPIDWAGVDSSGYPLPAGNYSFTVESYSNNERIGVNTAEVYALVNEAKLTSGDTLIVLSGGVEVSVSDIAALRAPGS